MDMVTVMNILILYVVVLMDLVVDFDNAMSGGYGNSSFCNGNGICNITNGECECKLDFLEKNVLFTIQYFYL